MMTRWYWPLVYALYLHIPLHYILSAFQFNLFANTIEDVSRIQYKALFDATEGLSRAITAQAQASEQTFPFVTLDNFEVYAHEARVGSKAETIGYSPIVRAADIQDFNAYAPEHAEAWVRSSQALAHELEGTSQGGLNHMNHDGMRRRNQEMTEEENGTMQQDDGSAQDCALYLQYHV